MPHVNIYSKLESKDSPNYRKLSEKTNSNDELVKNTYLLKSSSINFP